MAQAADIVAEVDSPALTILYDIYHQQITEGNLISNLRTYLPLIGHIHTAGVPGRHELADNEIDYRVVFQAIDESDYAGCVGLEFRAFTPRGGSAGSDGPNCGGVGLASALFSV